MKLVSKQDKQFMMQAIKLASCGLYTSYPNPAVGCVIVKDGKIIGKGYHHKAGEPHAEIMALTDANFDVEGATAYVTLEPCSHYGRTPPCAVKLVEVGIKRVVVACGDPNPKVHGRGFKILEDAGIEVVPHVLEKKAHFQARAFMKSIVSDYPYISVKTAMTLDAAIALKDGQSKWITNSQSRAKVQDLRAKSDCILTSSNTVIADDPSMSVRYEELDAKNFIKIDQKFIRQPLKVILDSNKRLDPSKYQIFKKGKVLWVIGSQDDSKFGNTEVIDDVITVLYVPLKNGHIKLESVFKYLGSLQIRRVFVEAGAILTSAIINSNLADEIYAFVAPKLLGNSSKGAFSSVESPKYLKDCKQFKLHSTKTFGDDVLLHYVVED